MVTIPSKVLVQTNLCWHGDQWNNTTLYTSESLADFHADRPVRAGVVPGNGVPTKGHGINLFFVAQKSAQSLQGHFARQSSRDSAMGRNKRPTQIRLGS